MRQFLKFLTAAILVFFIVMGSSCKKTEQAVPAVLTVQTVLGDVTVESGGKIIIPATGTVIAEDSIVKTGSLSIIDIKYKDSGVIRINEKSNMKVAQLFSSSQREETVLQMNKGNVFITVSRLGKDSRFQVKTPTAVAGIRGTSFKVSAEEGKFRIDVLAGKVHVNPVKDDKIIEDVGQFVETNKSVEVEKKDIDDIIAKKEVIEVMTLKPEEVQVIKEEAKLIKVDDTLNDEIKKEIREIGIETKSAEEIKDVKKYEEELKLQLEKIEKEKSAKQIVEKPAEKNNDDKILKEKMRQEKLEQEKLMKEKQLKEAQIKEKQKEESRVKNIPNF